VYDRFIGVSFDSGAGLDVLWKSLTILEPVEIVMKEPEYIFDGSWSPPPPPPPKLTSKSPELYEKTKMFRIPKKGEYYLTDWGNIKRCAKRRGVMAQPKRILRRKDQP
jgi:hypothetical protein